MNYVGVNFSKDIKLLTPDQRSSFASDQIREIENSHGNMSLQTLLNKITNLGFFSGSFPVSSYLKGREEDLRSVNILSLVRFATRCANNNQSNIVRAFVTKFISQECLTRINDEKIFNRIKLLNTFCTIDTIDPFLNMGLKIRTLITNLRDNLDTMDPYIYNQSQQIKNNHESRCKHFNFDTASCQQCHCLCSSRHNSI